MKKMDLALNNLQWLICHKTQPNWVISKSVKSLNCVPKMGPVFKNVIFRMCSEIIFICIKTIWNQITCNGRYGIKPNQSTCLQTMYTFIRINRIWRKITYQGWYAIKPTKPKQSKSACAHTHTHTHTHSHTYIYI